MKTPEPYYPWGRKAFPAGRFACDPGPAFCSDICTRNEEEDDLKNALVHLDAIQQGIRKKAASVDEAKGIRDKAQSFTHLCQAVRTIVGSTEQIRRDQTARRAPGWHHPGRHGKEQRRARQRSALP